MRLFKTTSIASIVGLLTIGWVVTVPAASTVQAVPLTCTNVKNMSADAQALLESAVSASLGQMKYPITSWKGSWDNCSMVGSYWMAVSANNTAENVIYLNGYYFPPGAHKKGPPLTGGAGETVNGVYANCEQYPGLCNPTRASVTVNAKVNKP